MYKKKKITSKYFYHLWQILLHSSIVNFFIDKINYSNNNNNNNKQNISRCHFLQEMCDLGFSNLVCFSSFLLLLRHPPLFYIHSYKLVSEVPHCLPLSLFPSICLVKLFKALLPH